MVQLRAVPATYKYRRRHPYRYLEMDVDGEIPAPLQTGIQKPSYLPLRPAALRRVTHRNGDGSYQRCSPCHRALRFSGGGTPSAGTGCSALRTATNMPMRMRLTYVRIRSQRHVSVCLKSAATANSIHSPDTPFNEWRPRSSKRMPDPATRSRTVLDTKTSPEPA